MSRFNEIVPASVRNVQTLPDQPTITPSELKAVFDAGSETIVEEYNKQAQKLNTLEPAGMISAFAGNEAPSGWLMCDGSLVDRSTYAELFTTIGTQYNLETDSDITKFRLPNLVGKTIVALDNTQTEFNALGKTGGEKTHLLTSAESGQKALTITGGAHTHWVGSTETGTKGSNQARVSGANNPTKYGTTSESHTHSVSASNANQAHNNLQPYIVLNYIIRT